MWNKKKKIKVVFCDLLKILGGLLAGGGGGGTKKEPKQIKRKILYEVGSYQDWLVATDQRKMQPKQ